MTKDEGLWTMDYGSVEKSSNRLIFSEKTGKKGTFSALKTGGKRQKLKKFFLKNGHFQVLLFPSSLKYLQWT